ncbi:TIGR04222 domain-containing membrane protein [Niastella caeni]|uniref:TIGR04222 domain-containing membrane protein n=1 Tax=Niastella caeni TaxID=2569763 RepID=A0A4V4H1N5_9BACT|nr:TIGR04222 domain-containing membrane protein [Niastella caeni]THU41026.1 TIGR04222 domain-containing membrane protein [Niastella caeni]
MNLPEHQPLWNNIQQFAFDEPNATITFSKKLADKQKWSPAFTERVIEEYRKFIFLCCISPKGASPSQAVDEAWHLHLTYTQSYWNAFCKNTLGKDIHHYPSTGGDKENHKHSNWYAETLQLYESVFGTRPPADIWPQPSKQSITIAAQPYRIDNQVAAIVVLILLLPFAINYFFTGEASPFSINGKQFLLFYIFLIVAAFIAHYLLQKNKLAYLKKVVDAWSPGDLSIYQLTYAVYGKDRAVETCLVDLYRRDLVQVNDNGKIVALRQRYQAPEKEDNPLVPGLLSKADNSTVEYDVIANDWYKQTDFEHPAISQLFWVGDQKESFFRKYLVILIVLFIGLARVTQGIYNDRPVLFLLLEIAVLIIGALIMEYNFSTDKVCFDRVKNLLQDNKGDRTLHSDEVVNDYARNGQTVLDWLPPGLMLASMFAIFPAATLARSPFVSGWRNRDNKSGGDNSTGADSCGGVTSCSYSNISCGSDGSGCGGCGGGGD